MFAQLGEQVVGYKPHGSSQGEEHNAERAATEEEDKSQCVAESVGKDACQTFSALNTPTANSALASGL